MHCNDVDNQCGGDVPAVAYYKNATTNYEYPGIVWCPAYFKYLKDHSDLVWDVEHDLTGQMRLNARNLRSTAASTLHELLHVRDSNAEICQGGCAYSPSAPLTTKYTDNNSSYDHNQTMATAAKK
jgi:glutaredoxin-related protein